MQNELYHHGIKGMRWGVRRYQNKDGSLTHQGKKKYGKNAILKGTNFEEGATSVDRNQRIGGHKA